MDCYPSLQPTRSGGQGFPGAQLVPFLRIEGRIYSIGSDPLSMISFGHEYDPLDAVGHDGLFQAGEAGRFEYTEASETIIRWVGSTPVGGIVQC